MTCELVRPDLVAFHFGDVSAETRALVEGHLEGCRACVHEYLALKRSIETAEEGPRPSPGARARLRAAVDAELAPADRSWKWWERPLAFGIAAAVIVVCVSLVGAIARSGGAAPHGIVLQTVAP